MTKLQEQRTQQAFLENEAAERETERKLAKAKANKVEEGETEEEEEEDEEELVDLVKCESMENLTKQVKRELELSDRLDKSLLRFLLHSFFIICILIILYCNHLPHAQRARQSEFRPRGLAGLRP